MFKTRVATFSILLPLFIYLLLYSSVEIFISVTSTVIIIAYFEWQQLLKSYNLLTNLINIIILFLLFFLITKSYWLDRDFIIKILLIASIFWVIATIELFLYSKFRKNILISTQMSCFFVFIPSWLAINYMQVYNRSLLILGCFIIIAADVGGYVFGKLYGKHKLTKISPNKTWEGVLGGYLVAMLVVAGYILFFNNYNIIFKLIIVSSLTFVFSIIGDLFESLQKRISGVKDSGNLLPGHGGILDRIDGFCSGMPIFVLGILLLN